MPLTITPANPARPDFVGVVAGIDLRQPISAADAAAIDAGMDHYGVLVFHGQDINDEQQLAFSRHFGPLETATGDIAKAADRRLSMEVNDISTSTRIPMYWRAMTGGACSAWAICCGTAIPPSRRRPRNIPCCRRA